MRSKLDTLLDLQKIDMRIQELEAQRGDLPQKVKAIKENLEQLSMEYQNKKNELNNADMEQKKATREIETARQKLKKYQDQLYNVTTNREYDAITQEIEAVKSEIDQLEFRILEIDEEKSNLSEISKELEEKKTTSAHNLEAVEEELQEKLNLTNREEENLRIQRQNLVTKIERPIYGTYERVRKAKNGVAVVSIQRGACGGCFTSIPPQRLMEIREKKKFITCEFCGRILVWDQELSQN